MFLRLGNMSPRKFAETVGAEFTDEEMAHLESSWSQQAILTGPEDFHIFTDPSVSITVGDEHSKTLDVLRAANERKPFKKVVPVSVDRERSVR